MLSTISISNIIYQWLVRRSRDSIWTSMKCQLSWCCYISCFGELWVNRDNSIVSFCSNELGSSLFWSLVAYSNYSRPIGSGRVWLLQTRKLLCLLLSTSLTWVTLGRTMRSIKARFALRMPGSLVLSTCISITYEEFYYAIVTWFEDDPEDEIVSETISWWNNVAVRQPPPTPCNPSIAHGRH